MIWLTWRQFRTQAAVTFGAIAVIAAVLAITGPRLAGRYHTSGNNFLNEISGTNSSLYVLSWLAVLAVPAFIGMFWGAPLVTRELDAGTHRLAWTQTTRTRWLLTKLGIIGLAAMAATGLLSLAVTWWAHPIDAAIAGLNGRPGPGIFVLPRMSPVIFGARGIVPVGYAALFFVLGVTIGVIIRRTLAGMVVLLAIFFVTQITMSVAVRPHVMTPEHLTTTITNANLIRIGRSGNLTVIVDHPGAWITSQHTVNAAGDAVGPPSWVEGCVSQSRAEGQACSTRLDSLGYRQLVSYHPDSRFWALQWYETVIYLVLALLFAGLCLWWISRLLGS
jgi:ABC-type transport system involved in multi-copper enzyme maturation permease subunit